MILQYTDIFEGGKKQKIKAEITTEHSASSYGMAVLVLPGGEVVSAESWMMLGYEIVSITQRETPIMDQWLKNLDAMYGMGMQESPGGHHDNH